MHSKRRLSIPLFIFGLVAAAASAATPEWTTVSDTVTTAHVARVGEVGTFFSQQDFPTQARVVVGIPVTVALTGCNRFVGAQQAELPDASRSVTLYTAQVPFPTACTAVVKYLPVIVPVPIVATHEEGPVVTRTIKIVNTANGDAYYQVRTDREMRTVLVSAIVPAQPVDGR